jgi:hypothetical protein
VTVPNPILFDPELLQRHAIIRRTPFWKDVVASMERLRNLQRPSANPYDQMDLDRDNLFSFSSNLRNASDTVAYSICLAAHLARFSNVQAPEQRLNEGFQALSSGLDLASLPEATTKNELQRCAQTAFSGLSLQFPAMGALVPPAVTAPGEYQATREEVNVDKAEATAEEQRSEQSDAVAPPSQPVANPWRIAVEDALAQVAVLIRPQMEDVIQRAADSWQNRLLGLLTSPPQPEISPDIDYLRCRVASHPLGMVLRGRLKNVSLREWNDVYISGMSAKGAATPVPLWFAVAALGYLGFDVPRDFNSPNFLAESSDATTFASKLPTASPRKGLAVLRLTADSQTAEWRINPTMPALIVTLDEWLRDAKVNVQKYFQERLNGLLIEVGRDEEPASVWARPGMNRIKDMLPSVKTGLLMMARTAKADSLGNVAVKPADAWEAYTQAFAAGTTAPSP